MDIPLLELALAGCADLLTIEDRDLLGVEFDFACPIVTATDLLIRRTATVMPKARRIGHMRITSCAEVHAPREAWAWLPSRTPNKDILRGTMASIYRHAVAARHHLADRTGLWSSRHSAFPERRQALLSTVRFSTPDWPTGLSDLGAGRALRLGKPFCRSSSGVRLLVRRSNRRYAVGHLVSAHWSDGQMVALPVRRARARLIPWVPKLVRLRIRLLRWIHWTWAADILDDHFTGWCWFYRAALTSVAIVLFYVGWSFVT